jgi:hypothetical protein
MNTSRSVRITVRGRLSGRLAAAFEGMTLIDRADGSELLGQISDQAQLHGLLTRIRDLGIELESVTTSEPPRPRRASGAPE